MTVKEQMRFEQKFAPGLNGCIEWTASLNSYGYGQLYMNHKHYKAHRVSYELYKGVIPNGACVLHHCDNRKCVNPEHLFLGNRTDNHCDAMSKGRHTRGESHGKARLTENQVLKIRELCSLKKPMGEIATMYGVTLANVSAIHRRKSWTHI